MSRSFPDTRFLLESNLKDMAFHGLTVFIKLAELQQGHFRVKRWTTFAESERIKRRTKYHERENK